MMGNFVIHSFIIISIYELFVFMHVWYTTKYAVAIMSLYSFDVKVWMLWPWTYFVLRTWIARVMISSIVA